MVRRIQQLHQTLGIFVRLVIRGVCLSGLFFRLSAIGTSDSIGGITSGPTHISVFISYGQKKRSSPSVGTLEVARCWGQMLREGLAHQPRLRCLPQGHSLPDVP